ncbi:MAG: NAD(P)-binding domain-containing protein, partial [Verrucomicrobiota bacterium]|nr:NAD(P)-binding domain-containing protein [Verrucomicrobiota bacterium]
MNYPNSEIGLIGLAVMGQNLALNIADHGFKISVFNRTYSKTLDFLQENDGLQNLSGFETINEFVDSLARPRKIIIMVQAGKATDAVIDSLLPLLDESDVVIDGGNAKWTDTILRERRLREQNLHFVGSGVSGGEEGARFGPSLMPGCS